MTTSGPVRDTPEAWPTTRHEVLGHGRVCDFVEDDITPPSGETFTRQYLTHMSIEWMHLAELVDAVYAGEVSSPSLVTGVLALHAALLDGRINDLRPAGAPWPAREVWAQRVAERASQQA